MFEITNPAARDRYFPAENRVSEEEMARFDEENPQAAEAWKRLHAMRTDTDVATDYVVVAD